MKLFCDSSVKEACYVPEGQEPVLTLYPEPVTVNVGEYKSVLVALEWANGQRLEEVEILTDSLLVVNQVNGSWKCKKGHLLPYREKVRRLLEETGYTLNWISREENLAGKVLEGY